VVDGQRTAVGELSFEVIPDLFVGIEFGRVGREAFDVKSRMTSEKLGERWAAMNGPAVPQQHDVAAELTQPQPQEGSNFEVAEVVEMAVTVEAVPLACGAHRDCGDGRDPVVAVACERIGQF
jgi:hypothetical protein